MASNSSDANATPVSIICSVCVESLTSDGSDIVTTNCGHAFHKRCLSDWYNSDNKDLSRSQRRYRCPKCNKMTKSDCTRDLFLDAEDDTEYVDVVKTVERLRLENAKTIETLSQKCAEMIRQREENMETVNHLRQEHSKEMERLHQENIKTADLLRQKNSKIVTLRVMHSEQMELLRQEHSEQMERLRQEHYEQMERLRQEHSEQMERLRQEHLKTIEQPSQDLKKQITVNEIKSILLGPNKDLLDEQFGRLQWDDLTSSFQNELWEKVPAKCRTLEFNKSISFSSSTLIHLIKSGPNDEELLLKVLEDYFEQQRKLNGHVTWDDFRKLFKQDLLLWLREKSERPSLELDELPLTPKIIVMLMKVEDDETYSGVTLVARMVELVIENISEVQINDISRRACTRLIRTIVPQKLEFCPCLVDMGERLPLIRSGILDEDIEKFLVHYSVIAYFAGMVMRRILPFAYEEPRFIKEIEHSENWTNYFLKYFYGAPSGFSMKLINLRDTITLDLVTIYLLMNPETNVNIFKNFIGNQSSAYRKHLLRMQWPFKIKSFIIHLTLVHLAALKGDYHEVQFLLCNMDFSNVLDQSRFQDLVQISVLQTSDESNEQIGERKKIIATFLQCSKKVSEYTRPVNVHIDLLKFLVERGPEVHEKIWSKKQMLHEAAEYLQPDHFHDLANWLVQNGHLEMLRTRDASGASPLDLAIQRFIIKPETIQLFHDAGVTLKTEIRKKMMDNCNVGIQK